MLGTELVKKDCDLTNFEKILHQNAPLLNNHFKREPGLAALVVLHAF